MSLDENKRPVVCPHIDVEPVEAEHWNYVCQDCGLKFVNAPRADTSTGRQRSQRMPRRKRNA